MKISENPELQKALEDKVNVNGIEVKYGLGGAHSAIPGIYTDIYEIDGNSLYPSIILQYKLGTTEFRAAYGEIYKDRQKFKKEGQKSKSDAYKLILNSLYGKLSDQFADNRTKAPNMALSICLIAQQIMTYAIEQRPKDDVVLVNTDAIWCRTKPTREELDHLSKVTKVGWDVDHYDKVVIKDTNNVVCIKDGKIVKRKGCFLERCKSHNTKANIIQKAVIEYLVYNTPVEETILTGDPIDYSYFARVRKENYFMLNEERISDQRIRYYAATEGDVIHRVTAKMKTTLCKDSPIKINMDLSELNDINYDYYADQAHKLITTILEG